MRQQIQIVNTSDRRFSLLRAVGRYCVIPEELNAYMGYSET